MVKPTSTEGLHSIHLATWTSIVINFTWLIIALFVFFVNVSLVWKWYWFCSTKRFIIIFTTQLMPVFIFCIKYVFKLAYVIIVWRMVKKNIFKDQCIAIWLEYLNLAQVRVYPYIISENRVTPVFCLDEYISSFQVIWVSVSVFCNYELFLL